jgi:hypothetical protein
MSLEVSNNTISSNTAQYGGGIYDTGYQVVFLRTNSVIEYNTVTGGNASTQAGGGIYFDLDHSCAVIPQGPIQYNYRYYNSQSYVDNLYYYYTP